MARIWRNRIIAGTKLFSQCPDRYKTEVNSLLWEDVENGVITEEEFYSILEK